ncbi:MAG: hypothetical protein HFF13_00455 [Angelakisella sp.]|nr:hypothetical protein [Angelakisella sp.]
MAKVFRYFLGANSPQGYISRFDQLGEAGAWRRWVVTGGSAQGRAALIAQAQKRLVPRCTEVEEIRSTGDPKRVEGLILPEHRIAIADGGPPHFLRPQCPGAYERVVSLWECLDQDTLYRAREELLALGEEEKRLWKDARGYLYAAGALTGDLASVGSAAMNRGKVLAYARGAALREFPHPLPGGKRGREQVRFLSALTGEGMVLLRETVATAAPRTIAIEDSWGAAANALLESLRELALESGVDVLVCRCPLFPFTKIDHLLLPQLGLGFVTLNRATASALEELCERTIHASRFCDGSILRERRARSSFLRKAAAGMLEQAGVLLAQAEEVRGRLDGIYHAAMDQEAAGKIARQVAEEMERAAR